MKKIFALLLVLTLVLVGCGQGTSTTDKPETTTGEAKTITKTVKGHNGDVEVTTTFDAAGKITEVKVGKHEETEGHSDPAISDVPKSIVEKNSVAVDTVGGATVTSKAIIDAVTQAITEAGFNPADYGAK